MPAGSATAVDPAALETVRKASLPALPGGSLRSAFNRTLNKFKASFYSTLGRVSDATDKNVARPLVQAENRVKVDVLQFRQSVVDAGASAADAADKGLQAAQTGVKRLKFVYIAVGVFVVVYFLAQVRTAFGGRS